MLSKKISKEEARGRLELLCVRGEHCRHELQEKLRKWGFYSSEIGEILDSLEERRFFDDSRFAESYARDKLLYNRWGRIKIAMGLRAKRIDSSIIAEALAGIDQQEYEQSARDFLQAKARSVKEGYTYEGRTRLYRAGLGHGFESGLVARIVRDQTIWGERQKIQEEGEEERKEEDDD